MASNNQKTNCNTCNSNNGAPKTGLNDLKNVSMEERIKLAMQHEEDRVDYMFIQRIIQELTQSCALPLPIPASAIPPLILQAAQWFWENDDASVEERYYVLPKDQIYKCGPNLTVVIPEMTLSVFGVYKITDSFNYGVMGDFSLERMVLNSANMASGMGGSINNTFNSGYNYNLTDLTAALYEISTFKSVFQSPITYNYNKYSHILVLLGDVGNSDLILQVYKRLKLQDLYNNIRFFRYVVCLAKKSLSTIYGTIEFKLPGGYQINYSKFSDEANEEIREINEWINKNHAADYFFNNNTI